MINKNYIIIFLYCAFVSCASPKALEYQNYRNLTLESLGFNKSQIKLDLEYYNPNNFGMQLKRTDLDIYLNNTFLAHSSFDTLIQIPRRDTSLFPIKFDVEMQNILKNALNTIFGNEVIIKITGKVKVGKANIFMNMPINYEGKHKFSIFSK